MIITGTNLIKGRLDLSSLERLYESNPVERYPFHATIVAGQAIQTDDKFYSLHNIQTALNGGYITITDYNAGGGGTSDHAALSNLDYASAGHTGFLPSTHLTDFNHSDIAHANRVALDAVSNVNTGDQDLSSYLQNGDNVSSLVNDSGYLTAETDPIFAASSWYATNNNSASWDSAFSWGNHASVGYLTEVNAAGIYFTQSNADAHINDLTIHFTEGSIDHLNIQNVGNNSHSQIDQDLTRLANTSGLNTGDQNLSSYLTIDDASNTYATIIDVGNHTGDSSIHFTEASISHNNILNIGTNSHDQIDLDLARLSNTSGLNTGDQDLSSYATTSALGSYAKLDGTNQPFTGDINISKANPRITLTDSATDSPTVYLEKLSTFDGSQLVSQNRRSAPANAISFLGTTGTMANPPSLGAFAISLWYWSDNSNYQNLFCNGTQNINFRGQAVSPPYIRVSGFGGSTIDFVGASGQPALAGRWTHLVFMRGSDGKGYFYYDGVASPQNGANIGTTTHSSFTIPLTTNGDVDEAIVYNRILTAGEVSALYNAGVPTRITDYTNVVAHWSADQSTGTTLTDNSGNGRNITGITGATWITGVVSSNVLESLTNVPIFKILNNATINSYGNLGFGYYSGSYGTSNIYDGLTHTFRILGTTRASLTGSTLAVTGNITASTTLTALGNIGGKTASPSYALDISDGNITALFGADGSATTRTNATSKITRLAQPHYTNAEEPMILIVGSSTNSVNRIDIGGGTSACNAATEIILYTAANQTTLIGTERMRITSAGDVGIGTAAPVTLFEVYGATGGLTLTRNTGVAAEEPFIRLRKGVTPADIAQIRGINGGGIRFTNGASDVEWARITLGGALLVGTTSLLVGLGNGLANTTQIEVKSKSVTDGTKYSFADLMLTGDVPTAHASSVYNIIGRIIFSNNSVTGTATTEKRLAQIAVATSTVQNSGVLTFLTTNSGTLGERLRITSAGNIGINSSAPDKMLEINSTDGNNLRLTYNDADGTASNYVDFLVTATGDLTITPSGGDIDAGSSVVKTTGAVQGVHKAADGTNAVADGTYNFYNDGVTSGQVTSFTIKDGIITSIAQIP